MKDSQSILIGICEVLEDEMRQLYGFGRRYEMKSVLLIIGNEHDTE